MTAVDQELIADAVKTALTAALPAGVVAYDLDEVPGTHGNGGELPAKYVLVFVARRWVPERRFGGVVDIPGGRLTLRYCADFIDNARTFRRIAQETLEDKALELTGGARVGPFSFEVDDPIKKDGVGWSGADVFTF